MLAPKIRSWPLGQSHVGSRLPPYRNSAWSSSKSLALLGQPDLEIELTSFACLLVLLVVCNLGLTSIVFLVYESISTKRRHLRRSRLTVPGTWRRSICKRREMENNNHHKPQLRITAHPQPLQPATTMTDNTTMILKYSVPRSSSKRVLSSKIKTL